MQPMRTSLEGRTGRAALPLALVALVACSSSGPSDDVIVRPATITSVDVLILESFPVQVNARVQGELGDGCTELLPVRQRRTGNEITLRFDTERLVDAICTQILRTFDQTVPLAGAFPPGRYLLRVNQVEARFDVD
jgi:inhibitor of cysteine peptidase